MMAAPAPSKTVSLDAINPSRKDLPVVVADDNSFLQDWLYLAGTRKQQFFALIDYQAAAQYTDNDTAQRSMAEGRRWWPIPAIDYKTFVAQHPVFLLARLSIHSDWIAQKLLADGAEVQLLEIHRELGFVSPETQIFLVRCKPSNMR